MEISVATQPDDDQDDTLDLTENMKIQNAEDTVAAEDDAAEVGDDEQERVTFADEEGDEPEDNTAMRQMRQQLRDKERRIRELEKSTAPAKIEIGPKPTMESCGFDEDEFEQKLDEWKEQTAAADRQETSQAEENRKINEAWQHDLSTFEQKKGVLAFEDRDDAIQAVIGSFPTEWHAAAVIKAVVAVGGDPALFFYALSKSEAKRAEIAKIDDPIKVGAVVARMEGAVKVVKGRKAPDPDRPERGSAQMPGGADKQLEKLEEEAKRNGGDRTKIIAFKADQLAKSRAK